jgi:hypothetical protein
MSEPLDVIPLWGFFLATVAVVLVSVEIGYHVGRYRRARTLDEKEAPVGAITAATLGLLGFMLAFTFGIAASRFDSRRQIVVQEANAIGTTYLRAGLLPDGRGAEIRKLLSQYVDARLEAAETFDLELVMQRSDLLHRELWQQAEAIGRDHPQSIVVGLFIESLNETIDIHATRIQVAVRTRIPLVLWGTLCLLTIFTMSGVGYFGGLSVSSRSLAVVVLALAFSSIIALVADLDRPREGLVRVSQQALIDLQSMMKEAG